MQSSEMKKNVVIIFKISIIWQRDQNFLYILVYIYHAVHLTAKANEFNYFLLYSTLDIDQFDI